MLDYISNILNQNGILTSSNEILPNLILILFVIIIGIISNLITTKILLPIFVVYVKNNKYKWDNIMYERKVFTRICYVVPPLIAYFFIKSFYIEYQDIIEKTIMVYLTIVSTLVIEALLNSVNYIYNSHSVSKTKPIKGIIQIFQILVYLFSVIIIISIIIEKSPVIILSGIGALTAILLIVFKDALLGLVAGVQIATNDLVRIGDWIEMPKYEANGEVVDISLTIVKVKNFDATITNLPSYTLISDSFKNWRHMIDDGGRRIKRSIYIDASSIEFCNTRMLEKFKKVNLLRDYITNKQIELDQYHSLNNINPTKSINARKLTNIGTFREYIYRYLCNNPNIHKDMLKMVRQLESGVNGVPLEIYAFTNDTEWTHYEKIQADIFDHLLSIAPEFNLRIFQNPTGYDIRDGLEKINIPETKV